MISIGYLLGGTLLQSRRTGIISPTLNLNFLSGTLDSRITFSRASNATVVDSTGRVAYAPNNLALRSEELDNSAWAKNAATITANAAVAPNGTTTADKLVETTAVTTGHYAGPTTTAVTTIGQTYVWSAYAKAAERTFFQLIATGIGPGNGNLIAGFDLTNGTAGTPTATVTSSITSVGGGWYRCSMAFPISTTTAMGLQVRLALNSTNSPSSYTGDGTSGAFVWGAQLEQVTYQTLPSAYNSTTVKNLLGFSEAFDNAAWTKTASTITPNATTSPDGTVNAEKLVENTGVSTQHRTQQAVVSVIGTSYTYSVYLKAGERTTVRVRAIGTATFADCTVNLTAGTISVVTGAATITNAGGGWYRVSVTGTTDSTTTTCYVNLMDAGSITYTGNGVSGAFIWGAQLSDSASLDPYVPTLGAAPTSAAYFGPRFDYDPVTLAPRGLLIEEQRVNFAINSEAVDLWAGFTGSSASSNVAAAPDGTTTADKLVESATLAGHFISQTSASVSYTSGTAYTRSCWLKADGRRYASVYLPGSNFASTGRTAIFDLQTGVVQSVESGVTATITPFANSWYRCTASAVANVTSSGHAGGTALLDNSLQGTYTGNGVSGVLIWGAQTELGSFPTSYIPTTTATATRAADNATMTGTNFSSWYNQSEGTMDADFGPFSGITGTNPGIVGIDDGTSSNTIRMFAGSGVSPVLNVITGGGGSQAYLSAGILTPSLISNIAGAYALNNFAKSVNGGATETDVSGTVPVVERMLIGFGSGGGINYLNGYIRSITYYPQRLSNSELQKLTPTLNLNFLSGTLDSRITFSRVSNATLVDSTGRLTYAPNNLLPRSEEFDNAAWVRANSTVTANVITSPAGTLSADRFVGDGTSTPHSIQQNLTYVTPAYILSVYAKKDTNNFVQLRFGAAAVSGGLGFANFDLNAGTVGTIGTGLSGASITPVGDGWFRCSILSTTIIPVASNIGIYVVTSATAASAEVNTLTTAVFLWGAQLEQVTYQTAPSAYTQTVASAYYGPRFDFDPTNREPRGLLIEEQRTNSIRNNTMVGAVAGAPGTLPNNWGRSSGPPLNGISTHIVGTGTEDGIPYVDVRVFGTNTAAGQQYVDVSFDSTNATAAQNQTWTQSVYYRLISGNFTGFASVVNLIYGTPGFNDNESTSITSITSAPLIRQRVVTTRTFTNVATTGTSPRVAFNVNTGATVDVTIRVGLPQHEQGAFATSAIPTGAATATRAVDNASMTGTNFSSWYNQSEGTIVVSSLPIVTAGAKYSFSFNDGTINELIAQYFLNNNVGHFVIDNGTAQVQLEASSFSGISKVATTYKLNDFAISLNGAPVATDVVGTIPTVTQMQIGNRSDGVRNMSSYIRSLTYYPQRIDNTQLQAL